MKTKILGLLTVALLAGSMAANAALLDFDLTDGTNLVRFQLDSNPTPVFSNVALFAFVDVPVSVNGSTSPYGLTFYAAGNPGGGLTIYDGSNLLDQSGAQLFSGTTESPFFEVGTFALTNTSCCAILQRNFTLTISRAQVPEPGTLALLGLGLAGLGLSRRRKAN